MTDRHEAICRALFAAAYGTAYGGPDAPYAPFWCDPNGCKGATHASHKDALAWFSHDDEADTFIRKLNELGFDVQEANVLAKAPAETSK